MFWGLGLWGYITSYKGISTNFVLREPSIYQKYVIVNFASGSSLISLSCPYTIKTPQNCKYQKTHKMFSVFCSNLSKVAHLVELYAFFERKMTVFPARGRFVVYFFHHFRRFSNIYSENLSNAADVFANFRSYPSNYFFLCAGGFDCIFKTENKRKVVTQTYEFRRYTKGKVA